MSAYDQCLQNATITATGSADWALGKITDFTDPSQQGRDNVWLQQYGLELRRKFEKKTVGLDQRIKVLIGNIRYELVIQKAQTVNGTQTDSWRDESVTVELDLIHGCQRSLSISEACSFVINYPEPALGVPKYLVRHPGEQNVSLWIENLEPGPARDWNWRTEFTKAIEPLWHASVLAVMTSRHFPAILYESILAKIPGKIWYDNLSPQIIRIQKHRGQKDGSASAPKFLAEI